MMPCRPSIKVWAYWIANSGSRKYRFASAKICARTVSRNTAAGNFDFDCKGEDNVISLSQTILLNHAVSPHSADNKKQGVNQFDSRPTELHRKITSEP